MRRARGNASRVTNKLAWLAEPIRLDYSRSPFTSRLDRIDRSLPVVRLTLQIAMAAFSGGCQMMLPAGTQPGDLAVSSSGTLREFVIAHGERLLVNEAELSAALDKIT